MTGERLGEQLKRMRITGAALSHLVDVNNRTVRRWICGSIPVPRAVFLLLHAIERNPGLYPDLLELIAREALEQEKR